MTDAPFSISATDTSPPAVTFSEDGVPVAVIGATETPPPPVPAPEPAPVPPPPESAPSPGLIAAVAAALTAAGPAPAPPAVSGAVVRAEALDYLRPGAQFSFVRDGFAVREAHDPDARDRLTRFGRMVEAGALSAGAPFSNLEVSARLLEAANEPTRVGQPSLIPPGYRPDLYVDQINFPRPLVDAAAQAPISDATPFTVPRFVSAPNFVTDVATEGVNPAPGVLTTELVTVTPKAVSGIYDASRELVDSSGGGVAIDMIVLGAMRESWAQRTEQRMATEITGAGNGTDVPAGASPTAAALLTAIMREVVALANRRKAAPTRILSDALAYAVLATDNAADGRPLLPWSAYTTSNVAGRTEAILGANIMGIGAELSWVLALTTVILERTSVYNFESPAQSFTFPEVVGPAQIRFAIFGYQAARVLRPAGVSRLTYTGTPTGLDGSSLLEDDDVGRVAGGKVIDGPLAGTRSDTEEAADAAEAAKNGDTGKAARK